MTPEIRSLFEASESGPKAYDAYNRGTKTDANGLRTIVPPNREIDFSALTLKEVMALQKLPKSNSESVFAVGLYQMTPDTTKHAVEALGLKGEQKFTPELQDRIFSEYLLRQKRPGIEAYIKDEGKNSLKSAQHELSKEWAGMPDPYKSGASHYGKGTSNKAHVGLDVTKAFLEDLRADYAQLRKDGLSESKAWAGLFDGRKIEHDVELPAPEKPVKTETKTPAKPPATPTKAVKEDEPDLLDVFSDIPLFKSMRGALDKIAGKGVGKKLDDILAKVDESEILSVVDKVSDEIAEISKKSLHALNEKYETTMSKHVPAQIEPTPITAPVYPIPAKPIDVPLPVSEGKINQPATNTSVQVCAPGRQADMRLLHQAEAHLAGEVGQKLGNLSETEKERIAHALVAEARISGLKHIAVVHVTQDKSGLVAFDGAADAPSSRRIYIDRAQAMSQTVERSASIIQNVAGPIENTFPDLQQQRTVTMQRP